MNQNTKKINPSARRKARKLALQAVFQWQFTQEPFNVIEARCLADVNPNKIDVDYLAELVRGVISNVSVIDAMFTPFLDRDFAEIDQVELAVLRIATYELSHRLDVPYRVVINEALELTKIYGSVEGFKYINGILDKTARTLRAAEMPNRG